MSRSKQQARDFGDLEKIFLRDYPVKSIFAEAFRNLRANIQFSFMEKKFQCLLVTSSNQDEGKTSIVANLSYAMAQSDKTVLMIDADLRNPFLSNFATTHDSPGLTGIITSLFGVDISIGSLSQYSVSDLFRLISQQKKTGCLHLIGNDHKVDLVFIKGELKDVVWLTRPAEKRLTTNLVKNGLVKQEEMIRAMSRHQSTGQKLGSILVNLGLIKQEDMAHLINIHLMEALHVAQQFKEGRFEFHGQYKSDLESVFSNSVDMNKLYKESIIGDENFLYLKEQIDSAVVETRVDNLFLLPSGTIPPNPSELLGSDTFLFLLQYLKKRFDFIVIDTPPILPASDALLLAPKTDGVVFVVRAGYVNREIVKRTADQLITAHANIIGVVLNQAVMRREGIYSYKYY